MYAIVQTGGKQYRVSEGDTVKVEKLDAKTGDTVQLSDVLAVGSGDELKVGTPFVSGAVVNAEVVEVGRSQKVIIYKYKAKKDSKKKQGHRQPFTKLLIKSISLDGKAEKAPAGKKSVAEAPAKTESKSDSIDLKSMKKAELQEYAASKNITLKSSMTKDEMIAAINAAE